VVERRRAASDAVQQATGSIGPWVFHRNDEPVRQFRRSWTSACVAAGLGHDIGDQDGKLVKKIAHRIPYDYRRSAAHNLADRLTKLAHTAATIEPEPNGQGREHGPCAEAKDR
jgi:hypothetical protein